MDIFGINGGEILVLIVAGLFILGPDRLPAAAAWVGKSIRQIREYATGAREQLKGDMGPEYEDLRRQIEELRGPLQELQSLRNMSPRALVTDKLLGGYDPVADVQSLVNEPALSDRTSSGKSLPSLPKTLEQGERPPFDPDAT
jgi:sec-independent protein translocase protein TatB